MPASCMKISVSADATRVQVRQARYTQCYGACELLEEDRKALQQDCEECVIGTNCDTVQVWPSRATPRPSNVAFLV